MPCVLCLLKYRCLVPPPPCLPGPYILLWYPRRALSWSLVLAALGNLA